MSVLVSLLFAFLLYENQFVDIFNCSAHRQEKAFQVPTPPAFPGKGFVYCDLPAFICTFLALKTGSLVIADSSEGVQKTSCLLALTKYPYLNLLQSSEVKENLKVEVKCTLT